MLDVAKNRRSWVTQRLANRYPPWSKVRKLAQSVGQQILEPAGRELESYYWWSNYNQANTLLNTSDVSQLEGTYRLDLPANFSFRTSHHTDSVVYLKPTSVRGKVDDVWVTLSQAEDNGLEEFWYGTPTRITAAGESYLYRSVLSSTSVTQLSGASLYDPPISCRLFVTLSNNGSSFKNYKGRQVRSSIKIVGRDAHGFEATEKIVFAYNGTIQTKTSWSEVSSVSTEYVDDVAHLRIDWLTVGQSEELDHYGLHVTCDREKFRFWSIGSQSFGSTLRYLTFDADDLVLVQEGEDSKHPEYEIELLNASGSNYTALDMTPWPKRRWLIVTDGSYLHFYFPAPPMENLDPLVEATTEAVVQIGTDKEWSFRGDTVRLDYTMKRPFIRVLRTRWSVVKPDGTRKCIAPDGSEITYSSSGWVNHPEGTTFAKVGFQGDVIDYELDSRGRYVLYLESIITDLLSSEGQSRPITHIDARVIHSSYDTASASLQLPVSIGTTAMVGFDSYHRPWVIDTNGSAHLLSFHFDKYLVDFTTKSIIVREEYTDLEVDA